METNVQEGSKRGLRRYWWIIVLAAVLILALAGFFTREQWQPLLGISPKTIDGMKLVYVPAGDFLMGSTEQEATEKRDICSVSGIDIETCTFFIFPEVPQHSVYLDAYWIDSTEVTVGMFTKFVEQTEYKTSAEIGGYGWVASLDGGVAEMPGATWREPFGPGKFENMDTYPVTQVSWEDARAYCEWAGRRLPTEAEWEKAARGTDGRPFPWGSQPPAGNLLNTCDKSCNFVYADQNIDDGYPFMAPVGSFPEGASPYGALDMAGNVMEWVADYYSPDYYADSPRDNPTGPTSSSNGDRVVRSIPAWVHLTTIGFNNIYRFWWSPEGSSESMGFRCVLPAKK